MGSRAAVRGIDRNCSHPRMLRFLARWRPGHLLAAWSVYWIGLAAAAITPIALAARRAADLGGPPNATDLNLSYSTSSGITVTITHLGHQLFQGAAGLWPMALAVAVPPLVLWGAWLYARPRGAGAIRRPAELGAPVADLEARARQRESVNR